MQQLLSVTKALSDETRLRALAALGGGELCLCQLIEVLGLAPSTVSKHMSVLQQAGLVLRRKEGRWHFYRLAGTSAPASALDGLAWVLASLDGDPSVVQDAARLAAIREQDLVELSACYRS